MTNLWFTKFKNQPSPGSQPTANTNPIALYTFHHAGGSCQFFQPWVAKLPSWIELIAVQLPGRWNRIQEPAFRHIEDLIPVLGPEFKQQLASCPNQQFAFYGHSLGGLVAYELTRYLMQENLQLPLHLFISSKRTLQVPSHRSAIFDLPDPQFEEMVTKLYGALPPEITADADIKKMFLAITKIDMEMLDSYHYTPEPMLNVPLTLLGGASDHVVNLDAMQGWKELTTSSCEIIQYPGDHFFLRGESQPAVLQKIVTTLEQYHKT